MAGADLEDEFDKDGFVEEFGADEASEPWHNSTRAVVGASAAGVAVIAALVAAIMFVTGRDDSTERAARLRRPVLLGDPSGNADLLATTTTATITSTTPLSTTEINGPPTPSTTSGSSDTSSTQQRMQPQPGPPAARGRRRKPRDPTPRRPRFNVTRTLGPGPTG